MKLPEPEAAGAATSSQILDQIHGASWNCPWNLWELPLSPTDGTILHPYSQKLPARNRVMGVPSPGRTATPQGAGGGETIFLANETKKEMLVMV